MMKVFISFPSISQRTRRTPAIHLYQLMPIQMKSYWWMYMSANREQDCDAREHNSRVAPNRS